MRLFIRQLVFGFLLFLLIITSGLLAGGLAIINQIVMLIPVIIIAISGIILSINQIFLPWIALLEELDPINSNNPARLAGSQSILVDGGPTCPLPTPDLDGRNTALFCRVVGRSSISSLHLHSCLPTTVQRRSRPKRCSKQRQLNQKVRHCIGQTSHK